MDGFRTSLAGLKGRLALAGSLFLALAGGNAGPVAAAETTTLNAEYIITLAGLTIGRADAEARITRTSYAAAITGSTFGISRFVSNAEAILIGSGSFKGATVVPSTYSLDTKEKGFDTQVRMSMRSGAITEMTAMPRLVEAPDRIPLKAVHTRDIVDPMGAFFVVRNWQGPDGNKRACDRTVQVFDGWQRFNVKLSYKGRNYISNTTGDSYGGEVIVCSARYIPVAGHRAGRDSVQYLAENKRLEVWLAPVKKTLLMVPYRVVIGTKVGDLVINAQSFVANSTDQRAATE
jgi:hypothetical protein